MRDLFKKSLLALGMLVLVACGGAKEAEKTETAAAPAVTEVKPEEGAKLIVWESKGPETDFLVEAAKEFTTKYNVPVEFKEVAMTETLTQLGTDGPAGTGADVLVFPHDRLGTAISSGLLLENLVSADRVNSEFMDAAVNASKFDGKSYGFPLGIETYALFYNTELLPEGVKTMEELIEKTKPMTDRKNNKFGLLWETANTYYAQAFLGSQGGYIFGKNGSDAQDIGINSDAAVAGITDMLKLKDISVEKTTDVNYNVMTGLFNEGKVAAIINGPWGVADTVKSGVKFAIAPLPTMNGKNLTSFSGVRMMGVSAFSKYPQAASLFADFITSKEMLLKRYEITKQIPPVKALLEAEEIKNNALVAPFLQQAQFAVPMPAIPEMNYVWGIVQAAVVDAWDNGVAVKEALDKQAVVLKDQIATQGKK